MFQVAIAQEKEKIKSLPSNDDVDLNVKLSCVRKSNLDLSSKLGRQQTNLARKMSAPQPIVNRVGMVQLDRCRLHNSRMPGWFLTTGSVFLVSSSSCALPLCEVGFPAVHFSHGTAITKTKKALL